MGCCASKDQEQEFTSINDGNPKSTDSDAAKGTPAPAPAAAGSKPKRPSRASVGEVKSGANANKWSMLESAEEKGFLRDEEEESQAAVDAVLKAEYPNLQKSRSRYAMPATWRQMSEKQDYGEGDFVFKRPWTMQQAHAFYFHLCQTDEARRNGKRSDAEPAFPKRCVYELMSDAYAMYDQLATERGALQRIPPPKSAAQKLKVCGDTHGQLQDVLWIFDEHGEPSADNAYLFNGDIADRGKNALEIFCLLLLYQLAEPRSIYINRGNHEQRDLNERPFTAGGGFAWEVRGKYPHDENLIELFMRFFNALPVAAVVGEWALVIHGGLFREPDIVLDDIAKIDFRRPPPQQLKTRDDKMLFDSLWADPHPGNGVIVGSQRGAFSATFGADITKDFCTRNGIKSVVRSHQLPKKQRGFEILHDAMLLTIFSASNYGGACRNKGGVLIFDEQGPAEVKEFYAPELAQLRALFEERTARKFQEQIALWKVAAMEGVEARAARQKDREKEGYTGWKHLLVKVDNKGKMTEADQKLIDSLPRRWSSSKCDDIGDASAAMEQASAAEVEASVKGTRQASERKRAIRRRTLVDFMLRNDTSAASAASASASDNGREVVSAHVYVEEDDDQSIADTEILSSMLAEVCKYKQSLTRAFRSAEKGEQRVTSESTRSMASKEGSSPGHAKRGLGRAKSATEVHKRTVSYTKWLEVLGLYMPEFHVSLWAEYGPQLLGPHTTPKLAPGEKPTEASRVFYVTWLARFQVDLQYDTYHTFSSSVLERLYERLLQHTKTLPMAQLFAHFDPNHDGNVARTELADALQALNLGLSKPQLEQLVLFLGVDDDEELSPIEAITLILEKIGPSIRSANRKRAQKRQRVSLVNKGISDDLADDSSLSSTSEAEVKLRKLGALIRDNMQGTMTAFHSIEVQQMFTRADGDGNGVLSRTEATNLLVELQAASGQAAIAEMPEDIEAILAHVDVDGNGTISFVEFLVAFGLEQGDDDIEDETDDESDAKPPLKLDSPFTLSHTQRKSNDGFTCTSSGRMPHENELVSQIAHDVAAALYERIHALQRAFTYLDIHGDGWLASADFEHAILLVLTKFPPRSPPNTAHLRAMASDSDRIERGIAASNAAAEAEAQRRTSSSKTADQLSMRGAEPGSENVVSDASVGALVASLAGSSLSDGKSPPRIDYCGFVLAFVVRDLEGEIIC